MQAITTLALVTLSFLVGLGLLHILGGGKNRSGMETLSLSVILGMGTASFLVFLLDVLTLPINPLTLWGVQVLFLVAVFLWKRDFPLSFFKQAQWGFKLHDIPPLLFIAFFGLISTWRAYYYPPHSYDATMGIDLVAKYAVRDGSIAGSQLFTELLPFSNYYTNQLFYAPFTMLMQVLTRGIGIDFGQVWLGLLSTFFYLYFYAVAKKHAHPGIAFFALLFILFAPEFYAYSFILQTDYSNAVFFFVGVYAFYSYTQDKSNASLGLAMAAMFLACWSRTETVFFMPFGSLWLLVEDYRKRKKIDWPLLKAPVFFSLSPILAVFLWSILYTELYLPDAVDLAGQIQPKVEGLFSLIAQNYSQMNNIVILQSGYWNYTVPVFFLFLGATVVMSLTRKALPEGGVMLFWIGVLYLGFHLLLILFPAVNIPFTFRRGFFKLIPLMGFYMVLSNLSAWISQKRQTA
ncbi:MAG: hypothetical protein RL181_2672 [Bacteroidota bacterium]